MKPLASRTDALRQSDIRAVTFAVNAVDGINLGQGICDLPTPDPIKAGAHDAIDGDNGAETQPDLPNRSPAPPDAVPPAGGAKP